MATKQSVVNIQQDGTVKFLHDDDTMEALSDLGRASICRLTEIEHNDVLDIWEVKEINTRRLLFCHKRRDACIEWEKENLDV